MTKIKCNLLNFSQKDVLLSVFGKYSNEFEYTADGIFRRIVPLPCPKCENQGNHNGFNTYRKKGLGHVKMGRYICPICKEPYEEDRSLWIELKKEFFSTLDELYLRFRSNNVSYEGSVDVMEIIFPRGKDTICNAFNRAVESIELPPIEDILIVYYDEQHPKEGRTQKFRLTLLDHLTRRPIADELFDSKDSATIKKFLEKHLDPNKPIFVVTDIANGYPAIFKEFFGKNLILQFCLMHLNKLIVKDFPRKTTIEQELIKYKLLNIFYNRDAEINFLSELVEEEKIMKDTTEYKTWLKKKKKLFRKFLHDLELGRRREKQNLEQRTYEEALIVFGDLLDNIRSFTTPVRKRLKMIEKNWEYFTAFYFVDGAPATNNPIENYYSTSLKTHRKKQLRTDRGINNQLKLSAMKRAGMLDRPQKTLLEIFLKFIPFLNPG